MEALFDFAGSAAPLIASAVKAGIVLVLGFYVANLVAALVKRRVLADERLDDTLGVFISSIVRWVILAIVFIAVLSLFGIEATSLVAMLGAATLAIGLALQGTLSNVAAGFMLILFRPYKLGDWVEVAGTSGTVTEMSLFTTVLLKPDNVKVIIPNGTVWGDTITNYSAFDTRRVDLVFGIDYGDDIEKAKKIILTTLGKDDRCFVDPEPWVRVTNLGDSSVDLTVRVWCQAADYWDLRFTLLQAVKEAFDKGGISIPYPHQVEIQKKA
ncbi:MAG: mechanosensitive ion channel domain-containing protein [Pseudomonadota bacterium]